MSWLYAQTWLWYLIAFVVGVLLAWLLLVLPQQRRLRTLRSVAGVDVGHDLYADSRRAVGVGAATATGAALFDSGPPDRDGTEPADPATDQLPRVEPDVGSDTTELPVQPAPDDTVTGEIPVLADADPDTNSTGSGAAPAEPTAGPDATGEDTAAPAVDDPVAESNGRPGPSRPDSEAAPAAPDATAPDATAPAEGGETGSDETGSDAADGEPAAAPGLLATPAAAVTPGPYPGSARTGPDGAAPGDEFTIKGNEDSMLFHTPDSPYYSRTKAEVWFSNAADAEAAGFTSWTRKKT